MKDDVRRANVRRKPLPILADPRRLVRTSTANRTDRRAAGRRSPHCRAAPPTYVRSQFAAEPLDALPAGIEMRPTSTSRSTARPTRDGAPVDDASSTAAPAGRPAPDDLEKRTCTPRGRRDEALGAQLRAIVRMRSAVRRREHAANVQADGSSSPSAYTATGCTPRTGWCRRSGARHPSRPSGARRAPPPRSAACGAPCMRRAGRTCLRTRSTRYRELGAIASRHVRTGSRNCASHSTGSARPAAPVSPR